MAGVISRYRRGPKTRIAGFARDEDGSFVIFSMFLLIAIFLITGIGLDVVRYESNRARMQNTLDRAILAAADMSQKMTAQDVVESYFDKAGMPGSLVNVTPSSGFNTKSVTATAKNDVKTMFMNWVGVDKLTPTAGGTAVESISDIEISLVLDISGSMSRDVYVPVVINNRYGSRIYMQSTGVTKLESLQEAAGDFVGTVFGGTVDARTSMSIVPYATQVNVGKTLLDKFVTTQEHSYSNCVDFDANDFKTTTMSTTQTLQRTGNFDPFYTAMPNRLVVCDTDNASSILPMSGSKTELVAKINGLKADGNTSIDVGMKWGAALLDPSLSTVVSGLVASSTASPTGKTPEGYSVPSSFIGRPFDYTNKYTMKVMVLMTDGVNTNQYKLNPAYASGNSGVWKYTNNGNTYYSVYYPEGHNKDRDYDGKKDEKYWRKDISGSGRWDDQPYGGVQATQMSFPELWNDMSIDYHARYLRRAILGDWDDYYAWNDEPYSYVNGTEKDNRLKDICDATKDQGVVIFAIGFEVDDDSARKMEECASSASHFYRVEGLEIKTAFQSIANAIGKLRLTK